MDRPPPAPVTPAGWLDLSLPIVPGMTVFEGDPAGAGVVIVEGLDLRAIEPGPYELICLPLRIADGDGAPARALLRPRTAKDLG